MNERLAPASPQPASEPFASFEFKLSREDYLILHRETVATRPEWRGYIKQQRRRALLNTLAGFAGAAVGLAPVFAYAFEMRVSETFVGLGVCFAAASASAIYSGSRIRAELEDQVQGKSLATPSRTDAYDWGVWRIAFHAEGVRFTTAYRDGFSRWAVMTEITEYPSFIVLEEISHGAYTIPRDQFATAEAAAAFVGRVRAHLRERGAGVAQRVGVYLATHDVGCPGCGYSLRGSTGVACPECGRALTLADVPAAIERPPTS